MDYTQTADSAVHSGTNKRMHVDDVPVPTIFSSKDANSLIWGLANLCEKAGVPLSQFDADDPASYDKIYQAVNAMVHDEGVISLGYNPHKRYKPGFLNYTDGYFYECYHPDGCLGKDPRDPVNRPDGWTNTDPTKPYYWIKIGKFLMLPEIGVPMPFPTLNLREGIIKYNGDANLHKDKFWRLAELYPNLINNNMITIADLRAEFIRGLDDGRGLDAGRIIISTQIDEFKRHNHNYIRAGSTDINDYLGGSAADYGLSGSGQEMSAGVGFSGGSETRPRNVAMLYCTRF